jgi:hypothetical protein
VGETLVFGTGGYSASGAEEGWQVNFGDITAVQLSATTPS